MPLSLASVPTEHGHWKPSGVIPSKLSVCSTSPSYSNWVEIGIWKGGDLRDKNTAGRVPIEGGAGK